MQLDRLKAYLFDRLGVTEEYPFDPDLAVFKVKGKIFAIISLSDHPLRMNLKCEPEKAVALRDVFDSVIPGFHMNKTHWNTVILEGDVPEAELCAMIDHSYDQVIKGMKKPDRLALGFK